MVICNTNDTLTCMNKKINFVFKENSPNSPNVMDVVVDRINLNYDMTHDTRHNSLYIIYSQLGLANIHPVTQLPDDVFFFQYEWHWWFPIDDYFGDNGFLSRNICPDNVMERIKNKTAYLVVSIPMESCIFPHHLSKIHSYFARTGIPPSQILYFTCSPNGAELYKKYCTDRNIEPSMTPMYIPFYMNVYRQFSLEKKIKYNNDPKEKEFLMFNRRWGSHPQRVLFLYYLYKEKLIDHFHISFSKTEIDNGETYTKHIHNFSVYIEDLVVDETILQEIENSLPLYLDSEDLKHDLTYGQFDKTLSLYNNSLINLVAETYFFSDVIHTTEKIFKPILYMQPFIVLSVPHYLKHLRNLGFKTFGNIWDESYDEELNHTKRFFKILELVKEISNWDDDKKSLVIEQCKSIVNHNLQQLINLKENKVITDLLEQYGVD